MSLGVGVEVSRLACSHCAQLCLLHADHDESAAVAATLTLLQLHDSRTPKPFLSSTFILYIASVMVFRHGNGKIRHIPIKKNLF